MDWVITSRVSGTLDHESATQISIQLIGTARPIEKLAAILKLISDPHSSPIPSISHPMYFQSRKKTESWSEAEDMRLLAGIHKFGLDSWGSVARFVGNNRVKTQCRQRWYRGLNPGIRRAGWTAEEDERLLEFVRRFGEKSWTRIAIEFGDRCDAQCRYRFNQISRCDEWKKPKRTKLPSIHSLIANVDGFERQAMIDGAVIKRSFGFPLFVPMDQATSM
jgi:hypothetical protein